MRNFKYGIFSIINFSLIESNFLIFVYDKSYIIS